MRVFSTAFSALIALRVRKQAYQHIPHPVLQDLAEFCYAYATTFDADPREDARKQGRRDVWLRIQAHLKLSDNDLYTIATGGTPPPPTQEDE
jgi:hypothetical protein